MDDGVLIFLTLNKNIGGKTHGKRRQVEETKLENWADNVTRSLMLCTKESNNS